MRYSVPHPAGYYLYYDTPSPFASLPFFPEPSRFYAALELAQPVPPGARFVGTGYDCQGIRARYDPVLLSPSTKQGGGEDLFATVGKVLLGVMLGKALQ